MPLQLSFPQINGVFPDWAKITMNVTGTNTPIIVPQIALESLNYGTKDNGELVFGTAEMALGQTTGQQSPEASCTMYLPAYSALIQSIALARTGVMTQLFNIGVSYNAGNGIIIQDMLFGCRIKGNTNDHRKGGTALTVQLQLQPIYIVSSGTLPNDDYAALQAAFISLLG